MTAQARHPLSRRWSTPARRALLALCLWLAAPVAAEVPLIITAAYEGATGRYPHGVLGDDLEYETLVLGLNSGKEVRFTLPETLVFEDTAPRMLTPGGRHVVVVESHQSEGARLAIYGPEGRTAATPFIGTRFRWLAPLGAADLDGDGVPEVAFVDRPHLAKTLRIWRFENERLTEVAALRGVTNHRIGEEDIAGGIRDCGEGPEMILADAGWQSLLALRFDGLEITLRQIGIDTSRDAFAAAMACGSG
jgi:hypothetical protein